MNEPQKLPCFQDAQGRDWNLRLTKGRSQAIRETCGIDFGQITDGKVFVDLATGDEKLACTLWILCEAQAEARAVAPEEFAELLDGQTLDGALDALVEAVILFTRRPMRAAVEKVIRKTLAAQEAAMTVVEEWLETRGDQLMTQVRQKATEAISTSGD